MAFEKILILDDEPMVRMSLKRLLHKHRYTVAVAETLAQARTYLSRDSFDLVFTDLRLPDGDGYTLLEELRQSPDAPFVVVMTGYGSVESAIQCMRAGAFDYIIKPFSSSQIEVVVKKAEDFGQLQNVARYYAQEEAHQSPLLGDGPAICQVRELIARVAPTEATVLITGQSGTGKELIASEIHNSSARSEATFIRVNCAAMSESLIESEFFGHEKGAFTGASQRRPGRFELAHGGTLLLDEVSEISPALQAKLLRVLQEKEFERVGGTKTIKTDVRVLATTNRDLAQSVQRGEFREDLYYRLNVFPIANPSLADRREDIPLLAEAFADRYGRQHGVRVTGFSEEAMNALVAHDWPGNVRELQNLVERAVILSRAGEPIEPPALGFAGVATSQREESAPAEGAGHAAVARALVARPLSKEAIEPMKEVERRYILAALKAADDNRTHTAKALGISLRSLRDKLRLWRETGQEEES